MKRYQETHQDTNYEIDQTKEYVFTMQTSRDHIETVNRYAQMEEAIKNLDKMKQGCVEIKNSAAYGRNQTDKCLFTGIRTHTHIHILQERDKGEGYWVSTCDKAIGILNDLEAVICKT